MSVGMRWAGGLLAGLLLFLALDAVWLLLMASRLYQPSIGHLMRPDFDPWAAASFYVLYFCGVGFFAVAPARRVGTAWLRGVLFGLVAYGTYDLTNQATLTGWPWHVTLIDLCWGAFVTSCAAALARRIAPAHMPIKPPIQDATRPLNFNDRPT